MTNSLESSRILVTGGAGLVGSHIVDRLAAEDVAEVIVLDNFVRGRIENLVGAQARLRQLTIVEADIRDTEAVKAAMKGV
ncbi:MAG TPA: NAD-dependent epimerase/dehydratase family protein, partial [Dehalococcoidia bacterium]|nr:NAD-dependent epimerase/dehydratase family protein [Dehalococcoidia bacterium]